MGARTIAAIAVLAATGLASGVVSADDVAIEEVIVIADGSLSARTSGAASFAQVTADELGLLRPTHVSEALARVPGVWISRGSGQEHLTAIRSAVLTGAGACGEFLLLQDGVAIRPQGFCNVNNLFELNTEQAHAIETWRGPASALLGGNAMRGALNVVTAMPDSTRLSLEGGPYGYAQARLATNAIFGDYDVGFSGLTTRSDGYRDDTGYEQHKANFLLRGAIGEWDVRASLSGTVLHQETGGFVLGFEAYEDSRLRDSNPNPEAYRDAWSSRLIVELSRGGWTVTPYLRRSQMRFIQHFLPGKPVESNEQTSYGVLVRHTLDNDGFRLTVGGQAEGFSSKLKQFQAGPTVGSAFLVATRPPGLHYDYDTDGYTLAAFLDGDWAIDESLSFIFSARAERVDYDYDNHHLIGNTRDDGTNCGFGGCLYTRPADRTDDFDNVAGRLGLRWTVSDAFELYTSISSGFRPPQATELYRLQSGQLIADIDSERLTAFELGLRTPNVSVALFSQRVRDFIFRDADGFNVSDGRTKSQGVELDGRWQLGKHELSAAITWAQHEYDFDRNLGRGEVIRKGDAVDTAPELLANLRWRHQITQALHHELELVVLGEHEINASNTHEYDGHEVVNWRAAWQVNDQLQVFARIINVLDEEYADRADFAFGNYRYFPAMPRQLYVGFDYNLQ